MVIGLDLVIAGPPTRPSLGLSYFIALSFGKVDGLDNRKVVEPKARTPIRPKPRGSLERDCIGDKHQALRTRGGRRALEGHRRLREINEAAQRLGGVRLRADSVWVGQRVR